MVETSNSIKQPQTPTKSTGPRLSRRRPINCGRCACAEGERIWEGRGARLSFRKTLRTPGSGGPAPGDAPPLGTPWLRGHHPGNTTFRSALSPPPLPVWDYETAWRPDKGFRERSRPRGLRFRVERGGGRGFARGLRSPSPPALGVRRSHGERRAALAGPVHLPGHQLRRHRLPVLRVPAQGPGRPRAQGQCCPQPALSGSGRGEPTVRLGPGHRRELSKRGNRPRRMSPGQGIEDLGPEFGYWDNCFTTPFLPSPSHDAE